VDHRRSGRADGHHWRARACAVLTGLGTVRADDPQLNVRAVQTPRQPIRIVIDSRLECPPTARLLQSAESPLWIVHALPPEQAAPRLAALRSAAIASLDLQDIALPADPDKPGKTDLRALMQVLGQRGINELHCEAGEKLNGSLLRAGVVDELLLYLAPQLLGEGAGLAALGPYQQINEGSRCDGMMCSGSAPICASSPVSLIPFLFEPSCSPDSSPPSAASPKSSPSVPRPVTANACACRSIRLGCRA
jgi:diaminohydroxyphosphoribosylaminopyrimidine deaminase (EC 3.5.4.26)/5-amino-6-(5-phosphoribosylamino)uracil reductase (EC 1.1.1.193)